MEQKSNGKILCLKNKFLNFSETKKFSNKSFLTFREHQPLVSYKRVSYKKKIQVLIMASKKERNHYDLKEIKNYSITKIFSNKLARKNPLLYILANEYRINGG